MRIAVKAWLASWSIFYGFGAPFFQYLFIRKNGFINQFTVADFVVGPILLITGLLLLRGRSGAAWLNAVAWSGFFTVCISAYSYFQLFESKAPMAGKLVVAAGAVISLTSLAVHAAIRRGTLPSRILNTSAA